MGNNRITITYSHSDKKGVRHYKVGGGLGANFSGTGSECERYVEIFRSKLHNRANRSEAFRASMVDGMADNFDFNAYPQTDDLLRNRIN